MAIEMSVQQSEVRPALRDALPAACREAALPRAAHDNETVVNLLQSIPARHTNKVGGIEQATLYDTLELLDMRQLLADATEWCGTEEYDALRVEVALDIAQKVNGALWYPDGGTDPLDATMPPALELMVSEQVTDCYGYTLLTSHCLEVVGLRHMIGWMNGHAHIVLPVTEDDHASAWFIDPLSPRLSRSLSGMVSRYELEGIEAQIGALGRAAICVRADEFKDPAHCEFSFDRLAQQHLWMKHSQTSGSALQSELIMSIFTPTNGRALLDLHRRYERAMAQENFSESAECMMAMRGMYPEIDPRNVAHLQQVETLVRQLSLNGEVARASRVIASYFDGMVQVNDPQVASCKAACLEMVHAA